MTDKARIRIEVACLAVVFGGGAGWGAFQAKFNSFEVAQSEQTQKIDRIDQRVAEMYCATLPPEKRPGCR